MNNELFDYIAASPTAYHACEHTGDILAKAGYTELCEADAWKLEKGKGYFVKRNGSALIAFRVPEKTYSGFMMTASHCDSPCLKIKENPEIEDKHYLYCLNLCLNECLCFVKHNFLPRSFLKFSCFC